MSAAGVRIIVFRVAGLLCGLDARAVREILPWQAATRVPGAPAAVRGLVNVRGQLVPVVQARPVLGFEPAPDEGSVMLLELAGRDVGLQVDQVVDLFTVTESDLSDRDELPGVDRRLVSAVGQHGDEWFVLLDLDALLTPMLSL